MPEIIQTESYYPHYEGLAVVGTASRRLLQVSSLRGDPGVAGDLVAVLSGPSAGLWFRIAQVIDANNYVLDGDLPEGDYAISITRGYINEVYEDNTIDTSSLAESSSVAFNLVGSARGDGGPRQPRDRGEAVLHLGRSDAGVAPGEHPDSGPLGLVAPAGLRPGRRGEYVPRPGVLGPHERRVGRLADHRRGDDHRRTRPVDPGEQRAALPQRVAHRQPLHLFR